MGKKTGQIYVANDNAAIELNGESIILHKGVTRVREGHALLEGRAYLFDPIKVEFDVEDASADPGKKRGE